MRVEGFTAETQSQAGLGTSMGNGVLEYWSVGGRLNRRKECDVGIAPAGQEGHARPSP